MLKLRTLLVLVIAAITGFAFGCSDDSNLGRVEVPELAIEGVSTGQLTLELPPDDSRPQSQPEDLRMRNTGLAPLRITKLEWVNKPSRLDAIGERGGDCSSDDDCGAGEICLVTTCAGLGLPETPYEVEPGLLSTIEFVVTKGSGELSCPDAPDDLPDDVFAEFYCGELRIETNATNDTGIVEKGKASIYFLRPDASGEIEINPDFLEFQQVQPGNVYMQTFSVQNTGAEDLEIRRIFPDMNAAFYRITGPPTPVTITSGESETWTLTVEIPADTPVEDYEGFNTIVVDSSAINASSGRLSVQLSAGAGNAPIIGVTPTTLDFSQNASQTITISNSGNATLQVSSLLVQPVEARDFYTFFIGGNDVTSSFQTQTIVKDESLDLEVRFNRPANNTDSAIGDLLIGNNDANANFRSTVVLLGDAGDVPIAKVYPLGFTFTAADGINATRTFVIRNVGTSALNVTDLMYNFSQGSEAEFSVADHTGMVAPGALKKGTVTFAGANATNDVGQVVFTTNDMFSTAAINLRALESGGEDVTATITPLFSNDARVGVAAAFSATDSTPAGVASGAIWTLAARPAGSSLFFSTTGEELRFIPDVAGTYEFTLQINQQNREDQEVYSLTVTE